MLLRKLLISSTFGLLAACNMVISEQPILTDGDRASIRPKDGIWLTEDKECVFDSHERESSWPSCAIWLIVRDSAREILIKDGKGQSEHSGYLIARGNPSIVQVQYTDKAKDDGKTFYVFFGLEPGPPDRNGRFATASTWEVKCGVKAESGSDIAPYPGISPECRPSSKDSIRSAALAGRATAEMAMHWHWLRPEPR